MDTGTLGTLRTLKNILCTWDTQKHSEKKNLTLYFENGHLDAGDTQDTQKYSVKKI